jgi:HSP20 family protein
MDLRHTLGSREAARELDDMVGRLNRLVTQGQSRRTGGEETMTLADWIPVVDVLETEQEFLIQADLPGVEKEHVKVSVQEGVLTVAGHRQQEQEQKGRRYHRTERSYGSFVRSFTVPDYVDDSKVAAEYKNGVLTVHLPKSENAKPKSIEVNIG